jgi:S-adenosylhomocysteine hydrolase
VGYAPRVPEHEFRLHPPDARLLAGRRALVTGATSGIGAGTAYELAAHGAAVAINHRGKVDKARAMAQAIEAARLMRADETRGAIVMISSVHESCRGSSSVTTARRRAA